MAVPEGPTDKRYTGNGVTKIFTIPFLLLASTDLDVFIDGVEISSGFTITNVGNPTSTITFTVAPVDQADIYLQLNVPFERLNDYQENGDFLSSTVNRDFDRIWQALKQLFRWSTRSLRLGNFDVDGAGWYRAKGNGIRDLKDPVEAQDASTKVWTQRFVGDVIGGMTGNPNLASNVFYRGPDGLPYTVQDMSGPEGAKLNGYMDRTVYGKLVESASVTDFGADRFGILDSTPAFLLAAATGRRSYMPAGAYRVAIDSLPSGAYFYGDGPGNTIIKPLASNARAAFALNSSSPASFIQDLTFEDFSLQGSVMDNGFSEQVHLLTLNGVKGCVIDRVHFVGFRGDGLYIGSGDVGGMERHNFDIKVRDALFDGLNNENRNGVSIIDGDNILIADSVFQNCTRPNMPGAIDIEPDSAAFHSVKNIKIVNNKFRNVGGNVGVVSLFMPTNVTPSPLGIKIIGNDFRDAVLTSNHADIFIGTNRVLTDSDISSAVTIARNVGRNGVRGIEVRAVKGVRIYDNDFENYKRSGASFGQSTTGQAPRNVDHFRNRYARCATGGGSGVEVFSINHFDHADNMIEECGNGQAGSYAMSYNLGASTHVKHSRNCYKSASGLTLQGIIKEASHSFDVATNSQIGDVFLNDLANNFAAHESDVTENPWIPVVTGASSSGTGSYSSQVGMFSRVGKQCRGWVMISVNAGHPGAGQQIQISMPLNLKSQPQLVGGFAVGLEGVTGAGSGAMAMANTGAVVNGVTGALRLFANSSGAQVQLIIPTGAFKIWCGFDVQVA